MKPKSRLTAQKSVMRPSKSHEATAAFVHLKDAAHAIPGVVALTSANMRMKNGKVVRKIPPGEIYPDKFLEGIARAVQTVEGMKEATGINPDLLREGIAFAASYAPFADSAEALARSVRQLVSGKRRDMTKDAKIAFEWLKWKADATDSAELIQLVEKLHKASGKGRKAGSKKAANNAPAAPDTTTPPKPGTPTT